MSVDVVTGKVRANFVNIKEKQSFDGSGEGNYNIQLLIPKGDEKGVTKIKNAIKKCIEEGKTSLWGNKIPSGMWNPLRDGDEERADEHPEYKDCFFITAKSKYQPGVIDKQKNEIFDLDEIYSGCYIRADITFFAFSNKMKGVGVSLNNIQKLADGQRLGGGRRNAEDAFSDDFEDDDDDFNDFI